MRKEKLFHLLVLLGFTLLSMTISPKPTVVMFTVG